MAAAAQILWDVIHYRLRKLEMANLAGAVSIAVALGLSLSEVAYRTLFAFVLNVFVYLNNDYVDLHFDLDSPDKDQDKTRFLQHNRGAAIALQWALVASWSPWPCPFPGTYWQHWCWAAEFVSPTRGGSSVAPMWTSSR